ncbi:MAG: antibiotic acetyltransferase [Lachnospiraceae bacterium]|nr:antibiotic acetyltransferase [Lachnospiraceae bacterium]
MIKRKLVEAGSWIYRVTLFRLVKICTELKTKSIIKPGAYFKNSTLGGRNYLGKNTVIKDTRLGFGSYINNNGDISHTVIGKYTSIGANVSTVIGNHPIREQVALHPAFTNPEKIFGFSYAKRKTFKDMEAHIEIGNDVWIGNNVLIMDGVRIADGSVIGTGAIVTKDTEPYSINVGVPAHKKGLRYDEETIKLLLSDKWWDKGEAWIIEHIEEFKDVGDFVGKIGKK